MTVRYPIHKNSNKKVEIRMVTNLRVSGVEIGMFKASSYIICNISLVGLLGGLNSYVTRNGTSVAQNGV